MKKLFLLLLILPVYLVMTGYVNCPLGSDETIRHESDCSKFYKCFDGTAMLQTCPPGTLFDAEGQVCDFESNVNCSSGNSRSCYTSRTTRCPSVIIGPIEITGADRVHCDFNGDGTPGSTCTEIDCEGIRLMRKCVK